MSLYTELARAAALPRGGLANWALRVSRSLDAYSSLFGGLSLLTQPTWYVSSAGSVTGGGESASTAISPSELARRFAGRVVAQDTVVNFVDSLPTACLTLNCVVLDAKSLTLAGTAPNRI